MLFKDIKMIAFFYVVFVNKRSFILFFIILLFSQVYGKSQKKDNIIYLEDNWTYSVSEDFVSEIPIIPEKFDHLADLLPTRRGYIWVRTTFTIPNRLKGKNLAIYLGVTKIAQECYINNHYIGTTGSFPPHAMFNGEKPSYYQIPREILNRDGTNTVVIKIWVDTVGKINKNPMISDMLEISQIEKVNNLFSSVIPFTISIFLFLISLLYLFFYFIRPEDKSNKSFGLLTFFSSFYLLTISYGEYPFPLNFGLDFLAFQKVFYSMIAFITMHYAVSFIRDFLNKVYKPAYQFVRIISLLIICIVPFFAKTSKTFYLLMYIGYDIAAIHFISSIVLIIQCLKKKNFKAITLLIGFSPVLFSLLLASLIHFFTTFQYTRLIIIFGWQLTILTFLGYLLLNYVKLFSRVEYVNSNLEKIVKTKTEELQKANQYLEEKNSALEFEKKQTVMELKLAAKLQESFYTLKNTSFKDWDVNYYFKPFESVSGDLYDLYQDNNKLKGIGIFDISGHGLASGLVTMLVKNIIYKDFFNGYKNDLVDVVYKMNDHIIEQKGHIENYLTGIIGKIKDDEIEIVNAGHPQPILARRNGEVSFITKADDKQCGVIGITDIPLLFASKKIKLNKGDFIVFYTDGVSEIKDTNNNYYGKKRLLQIIEQNYSMPAKDLTDLIVQDLYSFGKNQEIKDDITLMILSKK